ncbi:MAG: hypothetical protein RLZZ568_2268 [Cyanobacteriota bacterium]|jgi:uncharacterized protein (DUF433 family)
MVTAFKTYVDRREDAYWIADTRISLDSIIYAFRDGVSPEGIVQMFDLLTLEQVYGAIAYYLANQGVIDDYLQAGEALYFDQRNAMLQDNQDLIARLNQSRQVTI